MIYNNIVKQMSITKQLSVKDGNYLMMEKRQNVVKYLDRYQVDEGHCQLVHYLVVVRTKSIK